jgi:hypothetical protein
VNYNDRSDANFLLTKPEITLISPHGGETWGRGTSHTIQWASKGLDGKNAKIELQRWTGTAWEKAVDVTYTPVPIVAGSYQWDITTYEPVPGQYRVRIYWVEDPSVEDISPNTISIVDPSITVTSPNGGENYAINTTHSINWNAPGLIGTNVRISLMRWTGTTYQFDRCIIESTPATVGSDTSTSGSFDWEITQAIPEGQYKIAVTSTMYYPYPHWFDESDGPFTVFQRKIIMLTPNGGESWAPGDRHLIAWSETCGGYFNITLWKWTGSTSVYDSPIASPVGGTSWYWTPPPTQAAGQYTIRIQSTVFPEVVNESRSPFTITPAAIQVISPNGGEVWEAGTTHTVSWTAAGLSDANLSVKLYRWVPSIGDVLDTTFIDSASAVSGSYTWALPSTQQQADYRVIVQAVGKTYSDDSDAFFSITPPGGPMVTGLSPSTVTAGGPAFTLTVTGVHFAPTSIVRWNGADRTTTYVSPTTLTATILASDIVLQGSGQVTVYNPSTEQTSNVRVVTVSQPAVYPVPLITSINPTTKPVGSAEFLLSVYGENFTPYCSVRWNGSDRQTLAPPDYSPTFRWAVIPASDLVSAGTATITVFNPGPGGGTSNGVTFTIEAPPNPAPTITSISPSYKTPGGAAFTLTVTGTNYMTSSKVRWNGTDRPTTYISATQMTAAIPETDIAAPGSATVTVFNPMPGGGTSNGITFTITNGVLPDLEDEGPTYSSFTPIPVKATDTWTASSRIRNLGTETTQSFEVAYWLSTDQTISWDDYLIGWYIAPSGIPAGGTIDATTSWQLTANVPPGTYYLGIWVDDLNQVAESNEANNIALDDQMVTVIYATPTIWSLTPSSKTAGDGAFTLIVKGMNLYQESKVRWNGADRPTTYVSPIQLTAAIPASDVATAGTATVTVFNPTPGGGASNGVTFTITSPTVRGDLTGDGVVTWPDVVQCAYMSWELVPADPAADFDGQNGVDWNDVVRLAYYQWGLSTEL